jgi:hypothetical protein
MGLGVVPMDSRVHVLYMLMTLVILTDVTVVSRVAWSEVGTGVSVSISKNLSKHISLSKRLSAGVRTAVDIVSDHIDTYASKWQTSTEIMKCPALNAAFAAHVERCVLTVHIHMYMIVLTASSSIHI